VKFTNVRVITGLFCWKIRGQWTRSLEARVILRTVSLN